MRQKTVFMLIAMVLLGLPSHAETAGGTLLSIDGNPVSAAEFSHYYRQAACREKAGADWDAEEYYPVAEQLRPLFPDLCFEKISHCAGVFVFGGEQKD